MASKQLKDKKGKKMLKSKEMMTIKDFIKRKYPIYA